MKSFALSCPLFVSIYLFFVPPVPQTIPALVDSLPKSLLKQRERICLDNIIRQQCNSWNVMSYIKPDFFSHLFYALQILRRTEISTPGTEVASSCQKAHGQWRVGGENLNVAGTRIVLKFWRSQAKQESFPLKPVVRRITISILKQWPSTLGVSDSLVWSETNVSREQLREPWKGPSGCDKSASRTEFCLWILPPSSETLQGGLVFFLAICPLHWLLNLSPSSTMTNTLGCRWGVEGRGSWRGTVGRPWLFWTRQRDCTLKYLKLLQMPVCEHIIQ